MKLHMQRIVPLSFQPTNIDRINFLLFGKMKQIKTLSKEVSIYSFRKNGYSKKMKFNLI